MNYVDAMFLGVLAVADLALMAYMRDRRLQAARADKMMKCLKTALLRGDEDDELVPVKP